MLFPNTQKQRDPFPRDLMVPGRVSPIGPNGAQANGFNTSQFGKLGGNPALTGKPRGAKTVSNDAGPNKRYPNVTPFGTTKPHPGQPPVTDFPGGFPGLPQIQNGGQPPTGVGPPIQGGPLPPPTVQNPNDLMGMDGRDPLAHQRYWANQGYTWQGGNGQGVTDGQFVHNNNALSDYLAQNPAQGGGQGQGNGAHGGSGMGGGRPNPNGHLPGGHNPPGGDGSGPGAHNGGGNNQPTDPTAEEGLFDAQGMLNPGAINALRKQYGLPLDAQFENQRANLVNQLNTQMAAILSGRGTAQGQYGLDKARMDTQQGLDNRSLVDAMAGQGVYGSGIQNHNQTLLDTQYGRQNQDLGLGLTNSLGGLDLQQQQLQSGFTGSLSDLFADLIRRNAKTGGNAPKGKA